MAFMIKISEPCPNKFAVNELLDINLQKCYPGAQLLVLLILMSNYFPLIYSWVTALFTAKIAFGVIKGT